jgi:hypothetical protein
VATDLKTVLTKEERDEVRAWLRCDAARTLSPRLKAMSWNSLMLLLLDAADAAERAAPAQPAPEQGEEMGIANPADRLAAAEREMIEAAVAGAVASGWLGNSLERVHKLARSVQYWRRRAQAKRGGR